MNSRTSLLFPTLLDLLQFRAAECASATQIHGFTFLSDGEHVGGRVGFAELDRQARSIAAHLREHTKPGDRVMLVYPPGLEYIAAFFACVYAGVIAVPALPPTSARKLPRLRLMAQDAQASAALTLNDIASRRDALADDDALAKLSWLASDTMADASSDWRAPSVQPSDLVFLQYTSGSTGAPKGVMVSHENILANAAFSNTAFAIRSEDTIVSWLPPHHDFGLIGGILAPVYAGCHAVHLPPTAFLMRPYRWLKAISDYRARITGAPNFAYEMCVEKITEDKKQQLDLSCLELALNGAEPIRAKTLKKFADAFACCGLRAEALTPVYGLAESTLMVSANTRKKIGALPRTLTVDKSALALGAVETADGEPDTVQAVSAGLASVDCHQAAIIDPVAMLRLGENAVGEIWVRGPSVARGYWNDEQRSRQVFGVGVTGEDGTYLRTGDLGFIHDNELYVTGRIKETMIFNGRKVYPQDVEIAVEEIDPAFRSSGCAAFSIEDGDGAQLVIVQEVEARREAQTDTLASAVRARLAEQHGVTEVLAILLVKAGGIPRTSSGKIQRVLCKELFLSEEFSPIWQWRKEDGGAQAAPASRPPYSAPQSVTEKQLAAIWEDLLDTPRISIDENFFDLGGNSLLITLLHERLVKELDAAIAFADLFKYPTIRALAGFLSGQSSVRDYLQTQLSRQAANIDRSKRPAKNKAVAIIGMSGRFPGARNTEEFWDRLVQGVESIASLPKEALRKLGIADADIESKRYIGASAQLKDIDRFDAGFFGFTPREAEITDPQHRLFLECCWQALEDAGYDPSRYAGAVGVFAGASISTYLLDHVSTDKKLVASVGDVACLLSNDKDYLATRISYKLNLRGPSLTVQTACSTSLVAVHLACQSLLSGESDMALAGGISLRNWDKPGYARDDGGIFSADGHIRAFDAEASGTIFGSGAGVVVLKSLERAIADGDTVYAVIKGSGVTNDGTDKVGYTAPSVSGQALAIARAQMDADVGADSIAYIEAHGTGTPLGDPIEIDALTQAFRLSTERKQFCAIGSVKTNVGHLECAAGIAGLIKTALALRHRMLPPTLNFSRANPQIHFDDSPFFVNTECRPWPQQDTPRRAGVNSFGFGGTNVHMILEEAPAMAPSAPPKPYQLLTLSARSREALDAATTDLANFLRRHPETNLADVAYTGHVGRRHFAHRRTLVCADVEEAVRELEACNPGRAPALAAGEKRPLVFLFPGQGSQYVNMAKELYQFESVFRSEVDACADFLKPLLNSDLRAMLFAADDETQAAETLLGQTQYTQPALFVVEYALARQLMAWGITPDAMLGHSVGEYVAACLAGVFSREDALKLIARRGALIAGLPGGAMLAVQASADALTPLLNDELWIAAVNAPQMCSVSGTAQAIAALTDVLRARQIAFHALQTSHAFHSGMLDPILDEFAQALKSVKLSAPRLPYLSNVSGTWITAEQAADPRYWVAHLRQAVQFSGCVRELLQGQSPLLLEVGPGRALCGLVKQHQESGDAVALATLPHAASRSSALATVLQAVGQVWLHALPVDWDRFHQGEARRRIGLPTYPFERKRYWVEPAKQGHASSKADAAVRRDVADWFSVPSWKRSVHVPAAAPGAPEVHLVFSDHYGIDEHLIDALKASQDEIILVTEGDKFSEQSPDAYVVDSHQPAHYERLIESLALRGKMPGKITHLWSLSSPKSDLALDQTDFFYSLLFLVQALGKASVRRPMIFNVVSNGVHAVIGNELLFPAKATALGPCRVVPLEYPNIACRHIDIAISNSGSIDIALAQSIAGELRSAIDDAVVAYRGHHRWLPIYEPIQLSAPDASSRLRAGGHYLITGGLGGIGLCFADYLADKVTGARLTLSGRTALPEHAEWDAYLSVHDEHDAVAKKIRQLRHLESRGLQVRYLAADIADEADVRRLAREACSTFGPVNGIFHAAGLPGDEPIQSKTVERAQRVLAPKLTAAPLLDRVFDAAHLDFMLLCSSMGAIAPVVGQVDYCAANTFLDAFAQERRLNGNAHVVSVNWNSWQDIGMAADMALPAHLRGSHEKASYLSNGIAAKDAPALFDRLLCSHAAQVVVSPIDLDAVRDYTRNLNILFNPLLNPDASSKAQEDTQAPRPALATDYAAPRNALEQSIAEIWQDLFGIDKIGIHDNFFDLGGHSLLTTQMISKIRSAFKIDLPVTALFECTTIAKLAHQIDVHMHHSEEVEV